MASPKRDRRVLPHNLDAEASVLGGILLRNQVLALIPDLEPDDFYDMKHTIVFQAVRALEARSSPIDVVTLENEIESYGKLDAIGGVAFLGELALRVPTADNVEAYAKIVIDYRIRRQTMLELSEVIESGYAGDKDGPALIHDASAALMRVRTGQDVPVITMGELARREGAALLADIDAKAAGQAVFTGIPTGIDGIDVRIGGHPLGVPTYYAARPGFGKTTFAMTLGAAAKRFGDEDSLLCSWEDRAQSFGWRALAQESGLGTERIRARKVGAGDVDAIVRAMAAAPRTRQELFADCSHMEVEDLVRFGRRLNMQRQMTGKKKIRQFLIDYLQKIIWPQWARSDEQAIGHISNVLGQWAAQDDIAVVAFVQLNRGVENRDDHIPRLADLRGSGRMEQDGKLIFAIHHPWSFDPDEYAESLAKLLVLKNANGRSGFDIDVYWDRETHSIYNSEIDYGRARIARSYQ